MNNEDGSLLVSKYIESCDSFLHGLTSHVFIYKEPWLINQKVDNIQFDNFHSL